MGMKIESNKSEIIAEVDSKITVALEKIGLVAERYAKDNSPVDTGRLKNSITHQVSGLEVYIGTNVDYAPYVELGARGRDPAHFLQNAIENHMSEYVDIIKEELSR